MSQKTKTIFEFEISGSNYCCSLDEVGCLSTKKLYWDTDQWTGKEGWLNSWGELYEPWSDTLGNGVACIAVTGKGQKKEEAELTKLGFRVVGTWTGTHRTKVKLWFKKPKGQKWNTPNPKRKIRKAK